MFGPGGETMVNSRSIGAMCGVLAALLLAGCGRSTRQDASEPRGTFTVALTETTFPASQRLAEHTHLVLSVRNISGRTIPNIAATICNVTCAYPAPAGEGTSVAAFSHALEQPGLANPSRPVWVVDSAPRGGVTAYSNTWALGALPPNATARFDWGVTAVASGHHVVAWEIAAGLNGKARAVLASGSAPRGTFAVTISSARAQTYVNGNGQIVTTSARAP
jgi:hypothetical protein